jgi:hypothetical protein
VNTENEIMAKLEIEHIAELQKYKDEFETLGKNDWGLKDLISIFLPFILLSIANSFYDIETEIFQIICFIFLASAVVQGMIREQTKKQIAELICFLKLLIMSKRVAEISFIRAQRSLYKEKRA